MIMACDIELEVGKVSIAPYLCDAQCNEYLNQPILVVRKATREEYEAYYILSNGLRLANQQRYPYYYEITTD